MGNLLIFLTSYPIWFRMTILIFLFTIPLEFLIWATLSRIFLFKRLKIILENPALVDELLFLKYNKRWILNRSGTIENFAQINGINIIYLLKMDELWIENFIKKSRKRDFNRILKYAPDKGLFKCFLAGLKKSSYLVLFFKFLNDGEYLSKLRKLALSGIGEDFNRKKTYGIFKKNLNIIREMTGDPEWQVRYFALSILLYDNDERSVKAVWNGFNDQNALIRKIIIEEYYSADREKHYGELFNLFINDPVYDIRKTSWIRIKKDFSDLYILNPENLNEDQKMHVLELFDGDLSKKYSKDDENFALNILNSGNFELRMQASLFLNKAGALNRMILNVDLGDKEILERNYNLLEKAIEVNVTGFISCIKKTNNPAALLLASRVLCTKGDITFINYLSKKVFRISRRQKTITELYKKTLEAISKRGNDKALFLLLIELKKRKYNKEFNNIILQSIPERASHVFIGILVKLLKDNNFKENDSLKKVFLKMPVYFVLPEVLKIIKNDKIRYSNSIRLYAVRIIGEMGLPYCLQTILENFNLLNVDEAKEYAEVLGKYPKKILFNKVKTFLNNNDAKIRASIITALPYTGETDFINLIVKSLYDADPEIRIAAIRAIVDFKDNKAMNQMVDLLKDPVERVRSVASKAIGKNGDKSLILKLKEIINNKEETETVRKEAIQGLGYSKIIDSIDILIDRLDLENDFENEIINSLSFKKEKLELLRLINYFKNSSPQLKTKISKVFKLMDENGDEKLIALFKEKSFILREYMVEIFESIGYIEKLTRKLSHRDYYVRKDAAELLSLIGTKKAYRGIILAANDPVEDVRIQVMKALEKLETKKGTEILKSLENDPDRRVRRYFINTIEKLKTKV